MGGFVWSPRRIAALGQGVRAIDPATLYATGRAGAFFDFTAAGGQALGLLSSSLPTLTSITNGGTIAAAFGKRAADPLATLGVELVGNPGPYSTTSGWTNATLASVVVDTNRILLTNAAAGGYTYIGISTIAGRLYCISGTIEGGSTLVDFVVASTSSISDLINTFGSVSAGQVGTRSGYFVAVGSTSYVRVRTGSGSGATAYIRAMSVREVPARAARQSSALSRPLWSSGAPSSASVTVLRNQSIGTTQSMPSGIKISGVVYLEEPCTAAEIAGISKYLMAQGAGYNDDGAGKDLPITFPATFTGAIIYREVTP